jgi:hypothetical protein
MARDRLTFRQRDLSAAIKAIKAAGEKVARVEVRTDGVIVIPIEGCTPASANSDEAENLKTRKALEHAARRAKTTKL